MARTDKEKLKTAKDMILAFNHPNLKEAADTATNLKDLINRVKKIDRDAATRLENMD